MNTHAITSGEWKLLLDQRHEGCVSIFMPTYRPMGAARQDAVRLKNLWRTSREMLIAQRIGAEQAEMALRPILDLLDNEDFWRHPKRGFAVFCAPGFFRAFHLPYEIRERVVAGNRFYLRPLMPLHQLRGRFYILALSLKAVRLLEATWTGCERLELDGVPRSFAEMGYEEYYAVKKPGSGNAHGMASPGHGDHDQHKIERDVAHYFQEVAKALERKMPDRKAPLVLATVKDNAVLYLEANRHPVLLDEVILGNPDQISDRELHERAFKIAEPYFLRRRTEALERYVELEASDKVSSRVEVVVPAAHSGRVETLFLAPEGREVWGRYDRASAAVALVADDSQGAEAEELIDQAAVLTLQQGGMVYSLPEAELPGGGPAAAVFRY